NEGGGAELTSVSCGAAGNCAAAGSYTDGGGYTHAFVAGETNGKWRKAIKIPGLDALTPARADSVDSVSCASAGNCAAPRRYADGTRPPPVVAGTPADRPRGPPHKGP